MNTQVNQIYLDKKFTVTLKQTMGQGPLYLSHEIAIGLFIFTCNVKRTNNFTWIYFTKGIRDSDEYNIKLCWVLAIEVENVLGILSRYQLELFL